MHQIKQTLLFPFSNLSIFDRFSSNLCISIDICGDCRNFVFLFKRVKVLDGIKNWFGVNCQGPLTVVMGITVYRCL